jgi:hypothetical protein
MLTCLAFIAAAQEMPTFTELSRGMARLEKGHIGEQKVNDRRVFLKQLDGSHYYYVLPQGAAAYVEKVLSRTLAEDFCSSMEIHFTEASPHKWNFKGRYADAKEVSGQVFTDRSYFHNHSWVKVEGLLELTVTPLPLTLPHTLNLKAIKLCESTDLGLACGLAQNLSHLGE